MLTGKYFLSFILLGALAAPSVFAKVLVRWTQIGMPAAKRLGVNEIAIPWSNDAKAVLDAAREKGYRVYLESGLQDAAVAAEMAAKEGIAGLILVPGPAEKPDASAFSPKLRSANPKLTIRLLIPGGRQPQMRGQVIYERNGVLQVSSPTAQPWVDSNLAAVRMAHAFFPESQPIFTFTWDSTDPLQKKLGPRAEDYELAIAEAGAFHADLLMELPDNMQNSLGNDDSQAWATWKQVRRSIDFYAADNHDGQQLLATVGVWTDNEASAYEALNLMARHNIPFRVLSRDELNAATFKGLDVLIVFSAPGNEETKLITQLAAAGGTAVLVNVSGTFPWQSGNPLRRSQQAVAYGVGQGRVIEFAGTVSDPETFAQDIRRLMMKDVVPVSLWNSLTTLVVAYREGRGGRMNLELVNYEEESQQVQIQVKGTFQSIRYATPERRCCETITPRRVNGFTEFVVPYLVTGGRVVLEPTANLKH
jgi:hypothetical protein